MLFEELDTLGLDQEDADQDFDETEEPEEDLVNEEDEDGGESADTEEE